MRKIGTIIIVALCLLGCKNNNKQIRIKGEIEGLGNEMILVYGANNKGDALDTIYAKNSKFEYIAPIDTFTQVTLLFKNLEECPIYADKGDKIKVTGTASALNLLKVDGSETNDDMNTFKESITELSGSISNIKSQIYASYISGNEKKYNTLSQSPLLIKTEKEIKNKAESFIKEHLSSLASVYLLNKYFVQDKQPNMAKIKELTNQMSGQLKDNPFIQNLVKSLSANSVIEVGKAAPFINLANSSNKMISLSDYKDKYVLINFWASWDEVSMKENALISRLLNQYKDKKLAVLGISLDVDKKEWKKTLKKQSFAGEQVCDFNSWNSYAVTQYGVESLPHSVLINPQGNVIAMGLKDIELTKKLEEVFMKDQPTK